MAGEAVLFFAITTMGLFGASHIFTSAKSKEHLHETAELSDNTGDPVLASFVGRTTSYNSNHGNAMVSHVDNGPVMGLKPDRSLL